METSNVLFLGILVVLALGLTISGFALRRMSLALSAMAGWFIICVFSYLLSGDIYNALFWLSLALTITCGIEGALLNRTAGGDKVEEEIEYQNAMQKAIERRDIELNQRRENRQINRYK
jgi:hypothetical protein